MADHQQSHVQLLLEIAQEAGAGYELAFFDGLHVGGSFVEAAAGAGVEPGKTASKAINPEIALAKVSEIHVGDFKLTTLRRLDGVDRFKNVMIKHIDADQRKVARRLRRLFDQAVN